ncbi:restriction endonuclease subunit m : D12 class N6 adenine-specific DNA methyltransferase OS=Planctomyces limnophilus (strain ATCC 43296 / DSM 3776 / IFAM 1008 / 290) GN=Plim_4275 PE=4 SV=1: MethyltransfD12 [Gemmataceae bacterium]|nr:restriction endonuclease subunit m : D12 class N6 adenine-specific DNA methyltransferase OS=Planctomyces limnophilus (strain ATCC 43296 / DSM 3776 / IFAM 1008 / 290) GN=Plim_4275 PE=4 SV=1: MethyltransfD12 [Gemmataceae bacterium]VTU01023.1 restriction endonuclease subunit m : D12 class N6 adenine-specific DNA methyltransferase OS=Planctomyces limnophilus (strain ATCC 43296 / DSM 3776 / IFAM 1008 / 290) GN=Plim_4275 PE=4 SV=1: MethyltransfD12 [Gemmataceae bacterium]
MATTCDPHPLGDAAYSSLLPWFGAKRVLASRIVDLIGDHRCYWEPFCGSMAVLLNKPVVTQEMVNDLHGDLVNLARVVRDEELSQRLHWRLHRTLTAEGVFRESRDVVRAGLPPTVADPPSVDRAYHYFVASWQGLNGLAGCRDTSNGYARRFSSGGGAASTRFAGAVESLPWWHQRLRCVEIYSGCGIGICERVEDREGTVIYADPPYFDVGKEYKHSFAPADHERLAAALGRFKQTRVLLSYYEHPDIARLYPGWEKLEVATTKGLVSAAKRKEGRVDAPEVLLVNRTGGA